MAMQEILETVRRLIHKWVNTVTPLTQNVQVNQDIVFVKSIRRFDKGDHVIIRDTTGYEPFIIDTVDNDTNTIKFTTKSTHAWSSTNSVVMKTIHDLFVQGIYIGSPDVIVKYPAITVNGLSRSSEWMTLDSSKEHYEVEIGVFVQESTHEKGYKFLMEITDIIQKGLKRNAIPLVMDLTMISLAENAAQGDIIIKVNDKAKIGPYGHVYLEDDYDWQDNWIVTQYEAGNAIRLYSPCAFDFNKANTSVIIPHRHVYNSWPSDIQYGQIHKGELLKAAVIKWYAEEEESQWFRREETPFK